MQANGPTSATPPRLRSVDTHKPSRPPSPTAPPTSTAGRDTAGCSRSSGAASNPQIHEQSPQIARRGGSQEKATLSTSRPSNWRGSGSQRTTTSVSARSRSATISAIWTDPAAAAADVLGVVPTRKRWLQVDGLLESRADAAVRGRRTRALLLVLGRHVVGSCQPSEITVGVTALSASPAIRVQPLLTNVSEVLRFPCHRATG
jgi:hypothetical protein